jgi:hypothetical protein
MHPLQGASFLSTPLQGGILKPPALRVVADCSTTVKRQRRSSESASWPLTLQKRSWSEPRWGFLLLARMLSVACGGRFQRIALCLSLQALRASRELSNHRINSDPRQRRCAPPRVRYAERSGQRRDKPAQW